MKVSEFLMPYVLSRLIYNVSGKGEMREEAQRHELGAQPPAISDSWGKQGPRGEATKPCDSERRDTGTSDANSASVQRRRNYVWTPPAPRPGVLMDSCFCFEGQQV